MLKRAGYKCERCARYGKNVDATIAHHKIPVTEQPELRFDIKNGEALCTACHNAAHPEKAKASPRVFRAERFYG